jgi:hypothetical protein
MNRKITRLARGAKWGRLGASGLLLALTPCFSAALDSSASNADAASQPKPAALERSICRRETRELTE